MMRFVNLLQPLFHHMRINLGGGNIGVPQHQLHGAQIRSALQQVCRKTVPQHVRRQRTRNPARRPYPERIFHTPTRLNPRPRRFRNNVATAGAFPSSCARASVRYFSTIASAFFPTGTSRSLSPLPMHRTHPTFVSRSPTRRLTSSETRSPVEYRTSSIARSRKPSGVFASGCCNSFSTSSSRKYPGNDRRIFGDSRLIDGSAATNSFICANRKKLRSVTKFRATLWLSKFCRYSAARKSTKSSR